ALRAFGGASTVCGYVISRLTLYLAAALAVLGLVAVPADADLTNVTYKAEATLKETYDSNVYLQDNKPASFNVQQAELAGLHPVQANKGSFVTTILPK